MIEQYLQYLPYATDAEKQWIKAVQQHGSVTKAARALGKNDRSFRNAMQNLRNRAAKRHFTPPSNGLDYHTDEGYLIKGTTAQYDANGELKNFYVKTNIDHEEQVKLLEEYVHSFLKDVPQVKAPKPLKKYSDDIIPWFQIGDAHLGMLAHAAETGQNFDLKIAERELCAAFSILFDECTPCERCVINDLGDFTHYENYQGETEAGKHQQDYDVRFPKMIHVYARIMRFIVDKALTRFKHVDILINQGNHSRTNDIWMAILLKNVYGHTGRVHVLENSCEFIPYRMGNTFVMTHHSDKCKAGKLVGVMSEDFAQDWGESTFRYIDIGHYHHKDVKEYPGVVVEMWNTLAPKDKYSNDGGWRSRQSITRVDRSRTYGEVGRRVLPIQEVWDYIKKSMPNVELPNKRREVFTV